MTLTLLGGLLMVRWVPITDKTPSFRQVAIGFEDVVKPDQDWAAIARHLDQVDANAVSISVGRVEWAAFPWPGNTSLTSRQVRSTGVDYVARAIESVRTDAQGRKRQITLSIDTLSPATIAADRGLAGRSATGEISPYYASVSAWQGRLGDRLVRFAGVVAERYQPDEVALTELMFDGWTFGQADLASYRQATGSDDWPRSTTGTIDEQAKEIAGWRSSTLAALVGRVKGAVGSIRLGVDVRANPTDPAAGRPDSGHDYGLLLEHADELVVWSFFAVDGHGPKLSSDIAAGLRKAGIAPDRVVVQIGLWGRDEKGTIDPDELAVALKGATDHGMSRVSVTPLSLMTEAHWQTVAQAWT